MHSHFLVVFDFEEIPISDAELQDSILAKQTFVCDGQMKTSGASHMPRNADQRNTLGNIPSIGTCSQENPLQDLQKWPPTAADCIKLLSESSVPCSK